MKLYRFSSIGKLRARYWPMYTYQLDNADIRLRYKSEVRRAPRTYVKQITRASMNMYERGAYTEPRDPVIRVTQKRENGGRARIARTWPRTRARIHLREYTRTHASVYERKRGWRMDWRGVSANRQRRTFHRETVSLRDTRFQIRNGFRMKTRRL